MMRAGLDFIGALGLFAALFAALWIGAGFGF